MRMVEAVPSSVASAPPPKMPSLLKEIEDHDKKRGNLRYSFLFRRSKRQSVSSPALTAAAATVAATALIPASDDTAPSSDEAAAAASSRPEAHALDQLATSASSRMPAQSGQQRHKKNKKSLSAALEKLYLASFAAPAASTGAHARGAEVQGDEDHAAAAPSAAPPPAHAPAHADSRRVLQHNQDPMQPPPQHGALPSFDACVPFASATGQASAARSDGVLTPEAFAPSAPNGDAGSSGCDGAPYAARQTRWRMQRRSSLSDLPELLSAAPGAAPARPKTSHRSKPASPVAIGAHDGTGKGIGSTSSASPRATAPAHAPAFHMPFQKGLQPRVCGSRLLRASCDSGNASPRESADKQHASSPSMPLESLPSVSKNHALASAATLALAVPLAAASSTSLRSLSEQWELRQRQRQQQEQQQRRERGRQDGASLFHHADGASSRYCSVDANADTCTAQSGASTPGTRMRSSSLDSLVVICSDSSDSIEFVDDADGEGGEAYTNADAGAAALCGQSPFSSCSPSSKCVSITAAAAVAAISPKDSAAIARSPAALVGQAHDAAEKRGARRRTACSHAHRCASSSSSSSMSSLARIARSRQPHSLSARSSSESMSSFSTVLTSVSYTSRNGNSSRSSSDSGSVAAARLARKSAPPGESTNVAAAAGTAFSFAPAAAPTRTPPSPALSVHPFQTPTFGTICSDRGAGADGVHARYYGNAYGEEDTALGDGGCAEADAYGEEMETMQRDWSRPAHVDSPLLV
ncbi:hypothetical protein K437DRAFT_263492 [Tilletiaria anomala UBC 951]|uniref:Uncharacterized protein n=1 Tax=Tilletiaria anomala (strain ATCC 24038 / CBS 436.72 / UBC 951) TaxID=1037660 RepID=A0A066VPX8_TILAU|nr:uncharacterized protein K437DRAFT_263492 [Tilletiaria anomala UBC 951]KDN43536.1 hypothetical protein K437DRAFT_263492 [Tilletiaria anomala UBC 951]